MTGTSTLNLVGGLLTTTTWTICGLWMGGCLEHHEYHFVNNVNTEYVFSVFVGSTLSESVHGY
jgi:hypothetical protein